MSAEAEARLGKANRDYQSKHLTLRKRMLSVVATLGSSARMQTTPVTNGTNRLHRPRHPTDPPPRPHTTTATSSFVGWLACALITQEFPLGAVLILPVSLVAGIYIFPHSGEGGSLLELVWS